MSAEQNRPASDDDAPDTARVYERAKPEKEAGMGRLDNNKGTPTDRPDVMDRPIGNRQNPENQVNGEDIVDGKARQKLHRADRK